MLKIQGSLAVTSHGPRDLEHQSLDLKSCVLLLINPALPALPASPNVVPCFAWEREEVGMKLEYWILEPVTRITDGKTDTCVWCGWWFLPTIQITTIECYPLSSHDLDSPFPLPPSGTSTISPTLSSQQASNFFQYHGR